MSKVTELGIDERKRVQIVIDWIGRMAREYGGSVYEKNIYYAWDWGQALCRECYGSSWNDVVPETPTWNDVSRAISWENGEWPDWVDQERMKITVVTKQRGEKK